MQVKVTAPGGRASRMEAQGHVIVDSPSGQAVGDAGIYEVGQQVLRLNGHVVLTKEANVMRGNALEISMNTGLARLTSGGAPAQPGSLRDACKVCSCRLKGEVPRRPLQGVNRRKSLEFTQS